MNLRLILIRFSIALIAVGSIAVGYAKPAIAASQIIPSQIAPSRTAPIRQPSEQSIIAQCDSLIALTNRVVDSVDQISHAPASRPMDDPMDSLLAMVERVDHATAELQALSLTDTELLGMRADLITMYTGTSRAARALADAASRDDAEAMAQAFSALETATAAEGRLIPALNTYCQHTAQTLPTP